MNDDLSMTSLELGTHAFHALRTNNVNRQICITMLAEMHIVPDATESWMSGYSQEHLVSKDEAAAALTELKQILARRRHNNILEAKKKHASAIEQAQTRYAAEVAELSDAFLADIRNVLRREPTQQDIQAMDEMYVEYRQIHAATQDFRLPSESDEQARLRKVTEIGRRTIARYKASILPSRWETPEAKAQRLEEQAERTRIADQLNPAEELAQSQEISLIEKYQNRFLRNIDEGPNDGVA